MKIEPGMLVKDAYICKGVFQNLSDSMEQKCGTLYQFNYGNVTVLILLKAAVKMISRTV